MTTNILKCKNLSKKIGKKTILQNISFEMLEGDILGLIGENGAGKTTLIKSILSLVNFDGAVSICGHDVKQKFCKAIENVGAIVETPDFYLYMTGRANLKLKSNLYNISSNRIDEIINMLELNDYIDEKVSKYSLGMKQKLGIAMSLLNNPKLLILDEPTNGLDPSSIINLKKLILKLSKNNIAILISSHLLSILDDLCNKICIIKNGRFINNNFISSLKSDYYYIFKVSSTLDINLAFENEIIDDNTLKVKCNKEFIPLIIESFVKSNIFIYEVRKETISLENIYLSIGENYEISS